MAFYKINGLMLFCGVKSGRNVLVMLPPFIYTQKQKTQSLCIWIAVIVCAPADRGLFCPSLPLLLRGYHEENQSIHKITPFLWLCSYGVLLALGIVWVICKNHLFFSLFLKWKKPRIFLSLGSTMSYSILFWVQKSTELFFLCAVCCGRFLFSREFKSFQYRKIPIFLFCILL